MKIVIAISVFTYSKFNLKFSLKSGSSLSDSSDPTAATEFIILLYTPFQCNNIDLFMSFGTIFWDDTTIFWDDTTIFWDENLFLGQSPRYIVTTEQISAVLPRISHPRAFNMGELRNNMTSSGTITKKNGFFQFI